jgi:hypothetical protein
MEKTKVILVKMFYSMDTDLQGYFIFREKLIEIAS